VSNTGCSFEAKTLLPRAIFLFKNSGHSSYCLTGRRLPKTNKTPKLRQYNKKNFEDIADQTYDTTRFLEELRDSSICKELNGKGTQTTVRF
jgi:hypothetical protein